MDILEAYPLIPHAVAWVEVFIVGKNEGDLESSMELMRNAGAPLDECVEMVRSCIQEEVELNSVGEHEAALAETYYPSFRTYLAGRLGMM